MSTKSKKNYFATFTCDNGAEYGIAAMQKASKSDAEKYAAVRAKKIDGVKVVKTEVVALDDDAAINEAFLGAYPTLTKDAPAEKKAPKKDSAAKAVAKAANKASKESDAKGATKVQKAQAVKKAVVLALAKTDGNWDWMVRRLRNQAATFFAAKGSFGEKKELKASFDAQDNYVGVRQTAYTAGVSEDGWDEFMVVFFAAASQIKARE